MNSGSNNAYVPGQYPVFPQKKKKVWPWVLAGVFILLFVVVPIVAVITQLFGDYDDGWTADSPYVGVLYIEGTITSQGSEDYSYLGVYSETYNQQFLLDSVEQLINDEMNVGLVLYINSPGGELYPTDELYRALLEYKALGRPIYAYCAEMAASGGYYLACAADKIYANPICTTGSIGVTYGTHIDVSEFLERAGIKVTELASDNNKMMGSLFSPLTEEQLAIFQAQIDEYYQLFLEVVSAGRGLKESELRPLADGRTYTAKQAKAAGLIDDITDFQGAIDAMFVDQSFDSEVDIHYFEPEMEDYDITSFLFSAIKPNKRTELTELEAYLAAIRHFTGPLVYYPGR